MPTDWMIRDLPKKERPRERLLNQGSASLSDAELIAVLLRTGHKGTSVVELSMGLLNEKGGLQGLLGTTALSLRRPGLGPAKAASLLAALEIARRLARQSLEQEREPLSRPEEMVRYLALRYRIRDQEVLGALFLDNRGRLLGEREIYRGTLDRAAVEPREILKECLLRGAAAVVIFHNHPSGDPTPSFDDIAFTKNLAEAALVVGVRLADHLILGEGGTWATVRDRLAW